MIIGSIIITILYLALIGSFVYGFDKILEFKLEDIPAKTKFSVVIPFRNEAQNITVLLQSLNSLEYPKHLFEVILVDDYSNDNSVEIINTFLESKQHQNNSDRIKIELISNKRITKAPKKDAINTAIEHSKNNWIITTDADCILPKYWLNSFDEFIQKTNVECIAAPVLFNTENSFLNRFQVLDMLSLQGATIAGFGIKKPFLCNGANFAYKKSLFKTLNGFEGNTNIASGDDIFFLEKALKNNNKTLLYLKSKHAIVKTNTQSSWKSLVSQRIRWASKTTAYSNRFGKLTGVIVLIMNGLVITILLLALLNLFNIKLLGYLIFIKLNIDFLLIYKSALFFNQKPILKSYLLAFILYPFFSFYVATLSLFKTYKWKGRAFKK